jgi:hypothetical protein
MVVEAQKNVEYKLILYLRLGSIKVMQRIANSLITIQFRS